MFANIPRRRLALLIVPACCASVCLAAQTTTPTPPTSGSAKSSTLPKMSPAVKKAAAELDHAVNLHRAGKLNEAIAAYKSFLKLAAEAGLAPQAGLMAYQNLGAIYQLRGSVKNAETAYQQMLKLDPHSALACSQLANLYVAEHRLGECKQMATRALSLSPPAEIAASAHFAMSNAALMGRDAETAEKEFAQAVRLAPNNANGQLQFGVTLARRGKYRQALTVLQKAYTLAKMPQTLLTIALVKHELHDVPGAIEALDALLEEWPNNVDALYNRGTLLSQLGKGSDAITDFLKVLRLHPGFAPAEINLGQLYANIQNYTSARKYYGDALKTDAKNAKLLASLAYILMEDSRRRPSRGARQDDIKQAEEYLKRSIQIDPKDRQTQTVLGMLYERSSRYGDALALYRKLQAASPNDASLYALIARVFTEQRNVPAVLQTWKEYRQRKPDDPVSYQESAAILEASGNFKDAAAEWTELLARQPKNGNARVALAKDYAQMNRKDDARAEFLSVLALDTSGNDAPPSMRAGAAAAAEAANLEALRGLGRLAQDQKKYDEAIAWWNHVKTGEAAVAKRLGRAPEMETYLTIAKIYEDSGKTDLALQEYRALAETVPNSATPYERMARLYEAQDKLTEAAAAYNDAAKRSKDPAQYRLQIAEAFRRKGKLEQALAEFEALRKETPNDTRVLAPLAATYEQLHKDDQALEAYEALEKADPSATFVRGKQAVIYTRMKQYDKAIASYERALAAIPNDPQTYADIASVYRLEGKPEAYLPWLQARLAKSPSQVTLMSSVVDEYSRQKREEDGWAYVRESVEKHKSDRAVLTAYATLLSQRGKGKESLEVYRRIVAQYPADVEAVNALVEQLDQAGQKADVIGVYEAALARPELPAAQKAGLRRDLALRYTQAGKTAEATALYQAILKADPDDFFANSGLAQLLAAANREQEAIPLYLRLLKQPAYPPLVRAQIMDRLGSLYEKQNNKTEATNQYREALKINEKDIEALAGLKRLGTSAKP